MAAPSGAPASFDSELSGPWTAYRIWSATSRYHKAIMDRLTNWSLCLAIGGSAAVTLAEQFKGLPAGAGQLSHFLSPAAKPLEVFSTAAIALAAFLTQQAQANNRVSVWTRTRSAAESLKSGIFLYRAGAKPFDGIDRHNQMTQRFEKIISDLQGIEPRPPKTESSKPSLGPLTVTGYLSERVQDQIDWYQKRARQFLSKADFCRRSSLVLTGAGTLLTAGSIYVAGFSAWAPVVATIAASLTAHLKSQQYQTLNASYVSTALRLIRLRDEWSASAKTESDKEERNTFIQSCEETMSNENGSWSALWTK